MRSKKHKINWTNRTFLAVEKDWKLRRIKESIFLNSLNPSTEIDASKLMNPEKGMEMAECWKEFNPIVRDLLKKATSKSTPKSPKKVQKRKLPRKIGKWHTSCIMFVYRCDFSVFSFLVAKEKIIADENNLGKGEALDLLLSKLSAEQWNIEWINELLEVNPVYNFIDNHPKYEIHSNEIHSVQRNQLER